jgi:hypothetical protein
MGGLFSALAQAVLKLNACAGEAGPENFVLRQHG